MSERFPGVGLEERITAAIQLLGESVLGLVQGYPCTRLTRAAEVTSVVQEPNTWDDFFDVRLFGTRGEWHAWKLSRGEWGARLWLANENSFQLLHREFPLWGTKVEKYENQWALLTEANGAAVWVPEAAAQKVDKTGNRVIAILKAVEMVDYEQGTGLAGIVDCALREILPNPHGA